MTTCVTASTLKIEEAGHKNVKMDCTAANDDHLRLVFGDVSNRTFLVELLTEDVLEDPSFYRFATLIQYYLTEGNLWAFF